MAPKWSLTLTPRVGLVQPQYGGLSERGIFSANKIGVEGNLTYSSIRFFISRGSFMYWGRNSKVYLKWEGRFVNEENYLSNNGIQGCQ